jgi:hypothetical protein
VIQANSINKRCVMTSRISLPCVVCGLTGDPIHFVPSIREFFCGLHCPNCKPGRPAEDDLMELSRGKRRRRFGERGLFSMRWGWAVQDLQICA